MNFRGHLICGGLVGVGMAEAAVHFAYAERGDYATWGALFAATTFFSIFPDLDTASVPQRWFFRCVFALLLYLGWHEQYDLATLVAILSLLPLLDHHRGWTHSKISPLVVSLLLGAAYEYWRARHAFLGDFSWENLHALIRGHVIYLFACIVGWYTHLVLDGRFRVFPTERGHH